MENASFYDKNGLKKGAWSEDEDNKLRAYIQRYGHWNWGLLPKFAGVSRSGKSCRLRWMNYLRPNMKHGDFTEEEDTIIIDLHKELGNKWSTMATKLPGRSDNEIKNRWNTNLKKRAQNDLNATINSNVGIFDPDQANPEENEVQETNLEVNEEPEMILNGVSSDSPSSESQSACQLSSSDYATFSDFTPQIFDDELVSNFWKEAFLPDYDGITPSGDNSLSSFHFVNDFISQPSCEDMMLTDDFLWSTLGAYQDYMEFIE